MMFLLFLPVGQAAASDVPVPEAWVTWKKAAGALEIRPPAGQHVAPDAPLEGWLSLDGVRVELATIGAAVGGGWPLALAALDAHDLSGQLSLSLCEDAGTTCRMETLAFSGGFAGRKGAEALPAVAPEAPAAQVLHHPADADAAFARAQESGKRVLLDFSAVWCPPCQVLMAEILHDPQEAALLDAFEVVELDADDPSSFALKSRYAVGGYPTVVAAEADGTLVDRLLGYPGEDDTRTWLVETAGTLRGIPEILADPESVPPEEAAAAAKRLIKERKNDEALAMAQRAPDGLEKALVIFELEPTLGRLSELMSDAPDRLEDWVWDAYGLLADVEPGELEPERAALLALVSAAIPGADPIDASDYAYVAAALSEGAQSEALYGAAAALLRAGMTGDPRLDRGNYTGLAYLYDQAGDTEGGLAVLDEAIAAFPEEFTYHHAAAGLLKGAERYDEALAAEAEAAKYAYGDMSLRAAMSQAAILSKLERVDEARGVLQAALDNAERPEEGADVRTWRYIEKVEEQLTGLDGDAQAE